MKIRKVFIDCGAWTGDSIKAFKKFYKGFEIYGFECEPRLTKELTKLSEKLDFKFINKAVWINNKPINLYPGQGDLTQSSSLHKSKRKYIDKKNPVKVEAIDLSKWIIKNFNKEDYIICKMNIEGAEYKILPKMLKDGSIDYIDRLYMSWHWSKVKEFTKQQHESIVEAVAKRTTLLRWLFVEGEKEDVF